MKVTDEVQHNTAVAGPSAGVAKESLTMGEVVDRFWWKDGVSPPDTVTCISVGVAKADDGGVAALDTAGVASSEVREDEEDNECCMRCSHSGLL